MPALRLSTTARTTGAPSTRGRRGPGAADAMGEETTLEPDNSSGITLYNPGSATCLFKPGRGSVLMKLKALLVPEEWARFTALETRDSIGVWPSRACRPRLRRIRNGSHASGVKPSCSQL